MTQYKKIDNKFGNSYIERIDDNDVISFIPMDEANSDYQAYLKELTESLPDDPKGSK